MSEKSGQFASSLQGIAYGENNTVTGRGSLGDPNGERVPLADLSICNKMYVAEG